MGHARTGHLFRTYIQTVDRRCSSRGSARGLGSHGGAGLRSFSDGPSSLLRGERLELGDLDSLNRAVGRSAIDEVAVDWFYSKRNGSVGGQEESPTLVAAARAAGLRVLATVTNPDPITGDFDPAVAKAILASRAKRHKHAGALVDLCVALDYDGIDLDWESLRAKDKDRFSTFVEELAQALHAEGKILAIAVHAKTSEPGDWSGAKAEDWSRIGAAVDEFKVMTYDFSGPWSSPGPVAPPEWMDQVIAHAESLVPPEKILMGVPFYGYDWHGATADGLDWADAQALVTQYQPDIVRDASGEATFTYTDGNAVQHTVFFQDEEALQAKFAMMTANHAGIKGIAIWVLEREDPGFWDVIASALR